MKSLIIVLLITLAYSQTCASDESLFKGQCIKNSCFDTYLKRFKTVTGTDGIGRIPITFVGEIQWVGSNVEVTLQFTDDNFGDGTMNRDNSNSCIKDKLFYYKVGWTDEQVATYSITSTYNYTTSYRVWKFTIPAADLNSKLSADQTTNDQITYTGYFGFKFLVVDVVQVTYRFSFSLTLKTSTKTQISTTFNPLLQNDKATCVTEDKCIAEASSSLKFCNEPTCSSPTVSTKLFLNQNFWIIQKIETSGFTGFGLDLVSVYFKGTGLSKKVNPKSTNTSTKGQLIIGLSVDFAYDAGVDIYIDSKLASTGRRVLHRVLADNAGTPPDPAHAMQSTGDLGCIKLAESDTACPTCDQLKEKGITCSAQQETFNPGPSSGSLLLFATAILLLLI